MVANVIVEYPIKTLDKTFTYNVPESMQGKIKVGMQVIVPFNKTVLHGIVLSLENKPYDNSLKDIASLENPDIYLNSEQLLIGKYLKSQTLCPLITAFQTMLPSALKIKNQKHNYQKYVTYIKLIDTQKALEYIADHPKSKAQINILNKLLETDKILKKDLSLAPLKILLTNNLVQEEYEKDYRIKNNHRNLENMQTLNAEQEIAYQSIKDSLNENKVFLLEGVTGSGKTLVYMKVISDVIQNGKTAIVLVPEICLTTQTVKRFYDYFGSDVAIFHSGLSNGEKYDEYQKIYEGKVKIVVGTRSSIFVPLKNLGIIIIDEEHSDTYKQDSMPRYDTIDIAKYRASINNIPLVLASASPTLESKARAMKGVYKHLLITKRANNKPLPKTILVDMTKEISMKKMIISSTLENAISDALEHNEQIILLLNRRGYSTFISCASCGYTYKCPNCDISLTFHKSSNNLRCHYCGYNVIKDDLCPKCHEEGLTYLGLGTEKVSEKLSEMFPKAKIVRMDQDTTSKKGAYEKIINDFAHHEYDILLGTQMISKGLDFENVTLVGVINADSSLNIPDFRASEKTFALLYQTSGRAGRSQKEGKVIIQTFNVDNPVLGFVKDNNYQKFYEYEMNIRHKLLYPPYIYIAQLVIKGTDYQILSKEVNKIKKYLDSNLHDKEIIFGPTPAAVFKINNVYHFNIIIKYLNDINLKKILKSIDDEYYLNKNVQIEIVFNPSRF